FSSKSLVHFIARYSVKPRLESPIVLQAFELVKRVQENILSQIFGILTVIDHAIDKVQDSPSILLVYRVESLKITSAGFSNGFGLFSLQRLLERMRHSAQS